jgi:hypothetical protein
VSVDAKDELLRDIERELRTALPAKLAPNAEVVPGVADEDMAPSAVKRALIAIERAKALGVRW